MLLSGNINVIFKLFPCLLIDIFFLILKNCNMKNFIVFCLLLFSWPCYAFDREEHAIISLYKKINPAIVCIDSQINHGISCGTGCIIDKSGLILTSAHVIETGENIIVTTSNGQNYSAKVVKRFDKNEDIVLLKISTSEELKTVKFGDSEKIKVGQKVLAIGNPFGFNGTLTQGIISRIDYVKNRIQTDAAINPGSSGGPLLNKQGEIIGINQAIFNPDNNISNIGIGFAVPINAIKECLKTKRNNI